MRIQVLSLRNAEKGLGGRSGRGSADAAGTVAGEPKGGDKDVEDDKNDGGGIQLFRQIHIFGDFLFEEVAREITPGR